LGFYWRTISFNLLSSAADLVTRLVFLNLGEGAVTFGSSSYDTTGAINHGPNASNPLPIQLAQGRQLLIVDSNITGLVGNLNYSNPSGTTAFRSSLPLTSTRAKAFAFAHLDNRNGNFTRLAILNANAQAANITVKVYRADGSQVGMNSVQVLANSGYSAFLGEVVAASRF
jgi:hypothetical protein